MTINLATIESDCAGQRELDGYDKYVFRQVVASYPSRECHSDTFPIMICDHMHVATVKISVNGQADLHAVYSFYLYKIVFHDAVALKYG